MRSLAVQETQVLVLAHGETPQAVANSRGHLFERFVAKVLARFGYDEPRVEHLNVTDDGVELDVAVRHRLTGRSALAECKAYTSAVQAKELDAFYGKLSTRRLRQRDTDGFFFALPRLTQNGAEQARAIEENDPNFRYLNADAIADVVRDLGLLAAPPSEFGDPLVSDPAIVVTEDGVFSARKVLDPDERTAVEVAVWSVSGAVPAPTLELLRVSTFAAGVPVGDVRAIGPRPAARVEPEPVMIVEVRGSESDFEYQLPASPKYFVGRNNVVTEIERLVLSGQPGTLVINAQSGWGKSSLALRLKQSAVAARGHGVVFDSRTASSRSYVAGALRTAARAAERGKVLSLPTEASWASLPSALDTLKNASWSEDAGPLLIFFDQFENVFRDEALTREFRDLALGVNDIGRPIIVGFAWKTDLVGWTERHPYQLRDEIRGQAQVMNLPPLGAKEIDTLLRRLERELAAKLVPDLKQRLREYSQGLPWLFKKLAGHVLREVREGTTQAELVAEALNVQNLFQADLDELNPGEQEALKVIARYAPVPVSEVMDRVPADLVQSLVDRRLVVKVGERLDIYWDIFRDFLTTGRVPIEDSYILRMSPRSVARLLQALMALGGDASVSDLADVLKTSEGVVYNLSRELRLFGALAYAPNRVKLVEGIVTAEDPEEELRHRVAASLRRHRAFSTFTRLVEQQDGRVSIASLARNLPAAFPAIEVAETTWGTYARTYAVWFQYAGLAILHNQDLELAEDDARPTQRLLSDAISRRTVSGFPQRAPGPSLALLRDIATLASVEVQGNKQRMQASRDLLALGAVVQGDDGVVELVVPQLVDAAGNIDPAELRQLIEKMPGCADALAVLEADPAADAATLGELLRGQQRAEWSEETTRLVGKHLRGLAKEAGVETKRRGSGRGRRGDTAGQQLLDT